MEIHRPDQLMHEPAANAGPVERRRWEGLRDALMRTRVRVRIIRNETSKGMPYTRDEFILVDDYAFMTRPGVDKTANAFRKSALPYLKRRGYKIEELDVDPAPRMDGGNFIVPSRPTRILQGSFNKLGDLENKSEIKAATDRIQELTGRYTIDVPVSTWHLNSVANVLPDGKILVKLDETHRTDELSEMTGLNDLHAATAGVTDKGFERLLYVDGTDKVVTFSILPNDHADVVLGAEILTDQMRMRSIGMLANFTSVGDAIVGEDFPPALKDHLKEIVGTRLQFIGPREVGVDTFLMTDVGDAGGAGCATLPISNQKPRTPKL